MKKPVLGWVVDRVSKCKEASIIAVATTLESLDDPVEDLCKSLNISCFRGSEEDVLDRYYGTARFVSAKTGDIIVRITGDCPFIDPDVCDDVIRLLKKTGVDYASNISPPSFPDGLDCEVFTFETLEKAWSEAKLIYEREHVTQYIIKNPELFSSKNLSASEDFSDMRWTIDYPEDYEFLSAVAGRLGCYDFTYDNVLRLLKSEPELMDINTKHERNEGLQISIDNEIGAGL